MPDQSNKSILATILLKLGRNPDRSYFWFQAALFILLAYIFASWAIDSGSYWHYLLALLFFSGAGYNFLKLIRLHGKK